MLIALLAAASTVTAAPAAPAQSLALRDAARRVIPRAPLQLGTSPAARAVATVALLEANGDAIGWSAALAAGLELRPRETQALSRSDLRIVTVDGELAGLPLAWPLATALVGARTGDLALLAHAGALGSIDDRLAVAQDAALAAVRGSGRPGAALVDRARLVWLPSPLGTHKVWLVEGPADLAHATRPVFAVDARSGQVELIYDRVRFADARVFETDPVTTPTPIVAPLVTIDEGPGAPLRGPLFQALNCVAPSMSGEPCEPRTTVFADGAGNYEVPLPDVTNPADNVDGDDRYAELSMYYHADKFLAALQDVGFAGLPCHTREGGVATLIANYKEYDVSGGTVPFDNAFYAGDCEATMVFGQGSEADFAYDGDVVYHELGHGVVEQQMDGDFLGRSRLTPYGVAVDAGGLNEAIADFLSSSYSGDPIVADYLGAYWSVLPGGAIRNNENSYRCPDDLVGQVHNDGEPFGGLLWDVFERNGSAMVPVVLDLITLLPGDATLEEAAQALTELTAAALGSGAADEVRGLARARGLEDCVRVTRPDRLRRALYVRGFGGGITPYTPGAVQLELGELAAGRYALRFTARPRSNSFGQPGDPSPLGVVLRLDAPILFRWTERGGVTEVDAEADTPALEAVAEGSDRYRVEFELARAGVPVIALANFGDSEMLVDGFDVEFIGDPEPPPPPPEPAPDPTATTGTSGGESSGTTGEGTDGTTASSGTGEPPEPSSGGDTTGSEGIGLAAADGDGGCACRATPGDRPRDGWGAGALALLLLAWRRRRAPAQR